MHYFYSGEMPELLKNSNFEKLTDFLQEQPTVTLRQLKTVFPEKNFERFLDQMIQLGFVRREDRRYSLDFPIYEEKIPLVEILGLQEERLETADLVRICYEVIEALKQRTYFFALTDKQRLPMYFEAGNQIRFYSVLYQRNSCALPVYFTNNREGRTEKNPLELQQLIGDVNEEYFFDQVEVILERSNKQRKIRESIFLKALLETQILQEETNQVRVPVISSEKESFGLELDSIPTFRLFCLLDYLMNKLGQESLTFLIKDEKEEKSH